MEGTGLQPSLLVKHQRLAGLGHHKGAGGGRARLVPAWATVQRQCCAHRLGSHQSDQPCGMTKGSLLTWPGLWAAQLWLNVSV
jgi:hypothetical protein